MLKIDLKTSNIETNDRLEKYVQTKVGALEKYIPRSVRHSAYAEVRLKRSAGKGAPQTTCEITLHLPHENLHVRETTQHPYAALDVTTAHFRGQLGAYKTKHMPSSLRHRLVHKIGRRTQPEN